MAEQKQVVVTVPVSQPISQDEENGIQILASMIVQSGAGDPETAAMAAAGMVMQLKAAGLGIVATRQDVTILSFSEALELLKRGKRASRSGWNGKGMFVFLVRGVVDRLPIDDPGAHGAELAKFLPYLMMRTATGSFVPWLASQTDILAEDWTTIT
jgi:hypothetical protein